MPKTKASLGLLRLAPSSYAVRVLPRFESRWVEIDPMNITQAIALESRHLLGKRMKNFFFQDDLELEFEISGPPALDPTVYDLWVLGKPYQETAQYARMRNAIDSYLKGRTTQPGKEGAYWCRSHDDVDAYFENLFSCFQSMKREGYLTQTELRSRGVGEPKMEDTPASRSDEINVFIGAQGEYVFWPRGANHRFSIARILGLASVKTLLVGISMRWLKQQVRIDGLGYDRLIDESIKATGLAVRSSLR